MAQRLETVGGTVYRYVPDNAPIDADRWQSVARARLVDEITGQPVSEGVALTCRRHDLSTRVAAGGLIGLVARPLRSFAASPAPAVEIALTVAVDGYLPLELKPTVGPLVGSPPVFAATDLGDVGLHRHGVVLTGRVVRNTTVSQPLAGATIAIDAIWSSLPPANWSPPALQQAPDVMAIHPGLYASPVAGASVARRDLTVLPQSKTVLRPIAAGQTRLWLSDRLGLAAGAVLIVDRDDPMRIEAIRVAQVDTGSSADQAAWITLAYPVRTGHRDGVVCAPATPQAPLGANTLGREGAVGDPVVFLANPPAFAAGAWIQIADGLGDPQFQRVDRFEATSDAAGFFRLPAITRVAFVRLRVQHAGFSDASPIVSIDYAVALQPLTVAME